MQPTREIAERGALDPRKHEPDAIPELDAELAAEVGRLTAGEQGQSEIERIYTDYPGPVSRRKAVLNLSSPRLGACIQRHVRKGATELTVVCMEMEVILEIAYALRSDWLREGPVAQRKIILPLLKAERGAPELAPVGTPDGRPELKLKPSEKLRPGATLGGQKTTSPARAEIQIPESIQKPRPGRRT